MLPLRTCALAASLLVACSNPPSSDGTEESCGPLVYSFCDPHGDIVYCDGDREEPGVADFTACEADQRCVGGLMGTGMQNEVYRFAVCAWPGESCLEGDARCVSPTQAEYCRDDLWSLRIECYETEHCDTDAGGCTPNDETTASF